MSNPLVTPQRETGFKGDAMVCRGERLNIIFRPWFHAAPHSFIAVEAVKLFLQAGVPPYHQLLRFHIRGIQLCSQCIGKVLAVLVEIPFPVG